MITEKNLLISTNLDEEQKRTEHGNNKKIIETLSCILLVHE